MSNIRYISNWRKLSKVRFSKPKLPNLSKNSRLKTGKRSYINFSTLIKKEGKKYQKNSKSSWNTQESINLDSRKILRPLSKQLKRTEKGKDTHTIPISLNYILKYSRWLIREITKILILTNLQERLHNIPQVKITPALPRKVKKIKNTPKSSIFQKLYLETLTAITSECNQKNELR